MRKLLGLVLVSIVALAAWQQRAPSPAAGRPDRAEPSIVPAPDRTARQRADLPPEVAATLARIAAGGPFEHAQDGVVFGNYEHRLPQQPRGHYHEYTVPTPGARHRGTRRIVTGGTPPAVYYYTADHYRSFRRLEGPR
ncbi:ribonuclease domain-containing protein [Dyella sp.]|jgi:guanyl-specific ribonuclease Sa|uniref:ribonuclease domain-containing protein n=1 Tax=Dyella sp. TaxID=1869338 RepID=UPI002D79EBA7|nr:ribonuclease domain-containing protein [Dyella sp.]HET6432505.1 ribonuclease domain-containing protein [Dyella sp.]